MAAPVLQAEGAMLAATSGTISPVWPSHLTGDLGLLTTVYWVPGTTTPAAVQPVPSLYTKLIETQFPVGAIVGGACLMAKVATSGAEAAPSVTRGAGWTSGTSTFHAARIVTVRGADTADLAGGSAWDQLLSSAIFTTANQNAPAVTVSGIERLVMQLLIKSDDFVTAPTVSGYTAGTQVESASGTDGSMGTFRKDNQSSSSAAAASTVEAVAQGAYVFFGVSFKPPAAAVDVPWLSTPRYRAS